MGKAVDAQGVNGATFSAMGAVASAFGGLGKDGTRDLRKNLVAQLLNAVPGVGTAKEVALLDGNLLFHEPSLYLRHSKRVLDDALSILPVEFGALVLAAQIPLQG